jgi:hypothetical protein
LEVESRTLALPPELLGYIFSRVSEESPLVLGPSLLVCRTWHAIVVNDPTLWTTITLDFRAFDRLVAWSPWDISQDETLALALSFYDACLRRSRSALLKISVDLDSFSDWGEEQILESYLSVEIGIMTLSHLLTLFMDRTGEHAARWQEFVWKHNGSIYGQQDILRRLPQRLTSLQRLVIGPLTYDKPIFSDARQFPNCPNIQTLTLINFSDERLGLFQQSQLLTLKELTLSKIDGCNWVYSDLRCIADFWNICTLTLSAYGQEMYKQHRNARSIHVRLPHLRLLRLRGWIPSNILSPIKPPDNLTVIIGDYDGTGKFLDSVETMSGTEIATKMATLRLEWSDDVTDRISVSSVFELLKNAPCLRAVYLSPLVEAMMGCGFEELKSKHGCSFSVCTDRCVSQA